MSNELQTKLDAILADKQANLLPENLKKGISLLGVTGTLEGGTIEGDVSTYVKEFTSEEEMRNSASTLEDGTICKIVEHISEKKSLQECRKITNVIIPAKLILPSKIYDSTGAIVYDYLREEETEYEFLNIKGQNILSTSIVLKCQYLDNGEYKHYNLIYKYNSTESVYTCQDVVEDIFVQFKNVLTHDEEPMGTNHAEILPAINTMINDSYLTHMFEYKNGEFIELKDYNDNVAYISQEEGVYPEAKRTGDISLIHTFNGDTSISSDTDYPRVRFLKAIDKSTIPEGTYIYDNVIQYSTEEPYEKKIWQTITIQVTADKIIATCEVCNSGGTVSAIAEYLIDAGLTYDAVEYTLNTETNYYEYEGNTEWYFGNNEVVEIVIAGMNTGSITLPPLHIPNENWNDAFNLLCNTTYTLHGIYEYNAENQSYNHVSYGFNVKPENVLEGKKFYNDGTKTGTMKDNGELNYIPSDEEQIIPAGYTSGGKIAAIEKGAKIFSSTDEMNNSTGNKEGDLAVVYRSEVQNATVDSHFQTATFPDTVVLDNAITDYVEVRYRATDSSKMFDCMGQLDSSRFRMDCYSDSGEEE